MYLSEKALRLKTRHCVNSISLDFISEAKTSKAIFASGCFWGVQYHFNKEKGVIKTLAGYTGGHVKIQHTKRFALEPPVMPKQ